MKTLYISDLDGTLLNSDGILTDETISIINNLINTGTFFSVATARSLSRTQNVLNSLHLKYPIIIYNGVFLIDPITNNTLIYNNFSSVENKYLKSIFEKHNITPNVYSFINGIEKVSLIPDYTNKYKKYYLDSRKNDKRLNFVYNSNDLYLGDIFSYLCMGEKTKLQPIYELLKKDDRFNCVFQQELHREEYWLDIAPKSATKAHAAIKLKELLECDKIVAFR